jgi:hypothetical protein
MRVRLRRGGPPPRAARGAAGGGVGAAAPAPGGAQRQPPPASRPGPAFPLIPPAAHHCSVSRCSVSSSPVTPDAKPLRQPRHARDADSSWRASVIERPMTCGGGGAEVGGGGGRGGGGGGGGGGGRGGGRAGRGGRGGGGRGAGAAAARGGPRERRRGRRGAIALCPLRRARLAGAARCGAPATGAGAPPPRPAARARLKHGVRQLRPGRRVAAARGRGGAPLLAPVLRRRCVARGSSGARARAAGRRAPRRLHIRARHSRRVVLPRHAAERRQEALGDPAGQGVAKKGGWLIFGVALTTSRQTFEPSPTRKPQKPPRGPICLRACRPPQSRAPRPRQDTRPAHRGQDSGLRAPRGDGAPDRAVTGMLLFVALPASVAAFVALVLLM